jgi:hypothetical protein
MLNHLMLATLDNQTHQEWEQFTASRADTPTTAELVTFLECRVQGLRVTPEYSHQAWLLPINVQHSQLEARSVNLHTAM